MRYMRTNASSTASLRPPSSVKRKRAIGRHPYYAFCSMMRPPCSSFQAQVYSRNFSRPISSASSPACAAVFLYLPTAWQCPMARTGAHPIAAYPACGRDGSSNLPTIQTWRDPCAKHRLHWVAEWDHVRLGVCRTAFRLKPAFSSHHKYKRSSVLLKS